MSDEKAPAGGEIDALIERLKAHVADINDWNGRAMTNWDQWRAMIAAGDAGSEPRDCYESSIGAYAEEMAAAAAALAALQQTIADRNDALALTDDRLRAAEARVKALEAALDGLLVMLASMDKFPDLPEPHPVSVARALRSDG